MNLRCIAAQFIKYRVGNGRSVFVWHDNWQSLGPLKLRFGPRIIYDAASVEDAKLVDNDDMEAKTNSLPNRLLEQKITTKVQFYL